MTHLFTEDTRKPKERLNEQWLDVSRAVREHLHEDSEAKKAGSTNHFAEVREQAKATPSSDTDGGQDRAEMAELTRIDGALTSIAASVYGLCTRCGAVIASGRLRAIPTAELCLDCQMTFEQQQNHLYGGGSNQMQDAVNKSSPKKSK